MTPRKLLGAGALGTPTALLAHMMLFGDGHTVAGSLHGLVTDGALAAASFFLVFLGSLAWRTARVIPTGSILAARLRDYLPAPLLLVATGTLSYLGVESLEAHHDAPNVFVFVLVLFATAILVHGLATIAIRACAAIALACSATTVCRIRTERYRMRIAPQRFVPAPLVVITKRFSRPPPFLYAKLPSLFFSNKQRSLSCALLYQRCQQRLLQLR